MKTKQQIIPSIWFDHQAKEAFSYYEDIFPDSQITKDQDIVVEAKLMGVDFIGINGGSIFKPNPSISFMAVLETKEKIDEIWDKLKEGGKVMMELASYPFSEHYGWVEDKYGVSWQLYFGKLDHVNEQAIVPTLMFSDEQQGNCREALGFYKSMFKDYEEQGVLAYPEEPVKGQVMHSQFVINGFTMAAMDSGVPMEVNFNEGVSITITCRDQEEIDYFWEKITQEGSESMCGWCKDKFGMSWQVVPEHISELLANNPKAGSALMKMHKIEINELKRA